jgi:hypothetical protein
VSQLWVKKIEKIKFFLQVQLFNFQKVVRFWQKWSQKNGRNLLTSPIFVLYICTVVSAIRHRVININDIGVENFIKNRSV